MGPSLAVVGSGPAAFYTALRVAQKVPAVRISMFERHAFPFGLTRFGVAPDHPEVKNCQERFAELAAGAQSFTFHGNCEIGKDVSLPALSSGFDAVLLAYGASGERALGVPGEAETRGVLSARAFVGWYNGDPAFRDLEMAPLLRGARTATIIGNGNVALDVARILLRDPAELLKTDMCIHAVDSLQQSGVNSVQVVGRRGLLQSAFTNKELRELIREPGASMLRVDPESETAIEATARADKRKLDLIRSAETGNSRLLQGQKTWQLKFLRSPREFVAENGRLRAVVYDINEMRGDGAVVRTGRTETVETELAFTSIGYKSHEIAGLAEIGGRFNSDTHTIARQRGRATGTRNVFAAGWIATGPVGVIASTMMDSFAVGDEIAAFLQSHEAGSRSVVPSKQQPPELLHPNTVSWRDWTYIDNEEIRRGKAAGRPREKFTSTSEAVEFLHALKRGSP